jgi:Ca-activated chloride channel family protein
VHITSQLDLDVLAVEIDDQVSLLLELTAPAADPGQSAAPRTLVVVLDRSGSMAGARLDAAKRALTELVDRLDPADRFGLVTFDNQVQVQIAAAVLVDKPAAKQRIARIHPGGSTDLSAGYLRGLQEAARSADGAGATVLLISDGHANAGVTDPERLRGVAAKAGGQRVVTTTLGLGLGYDERLLSAIAAGGNGSELFAEHADAAVAAIATEIDGLLAQTAQAASVLIRMAPTCKRLMLVNELSSSVTPHGVLVELGAFYSGETRRLVITFDVPGIAALGPAAVADLDVSWVELPALIQHTVTVPVQVNVLPGDLAAGRVPDPVVRTELAYLQTQRAKRAAAQQLSQGDSAGAAISLGLARSLLAGAAPAAPAAMRTAFDEDLAVIDDLEREVASGSLSRAAKRASADTALKSRRRGSAGRA